MPSETMTRNIGFPADFEEAGNLVASAKEQTWRAGLCQRGQTCATIARCEPGKVTDLTQKI